jgi:hypothetical protein
MDPEMRQVLSEMVEAMEAVLVALQVEQKDAPHPESDFSLMEAVRRVNRLRRTIQETLGQSSDGGG